MRLALFAEMVKGKPWTPATLREVGGTKESASHSWKRRLPPPPLHRTSRYTRRRPRPCSKLCLPEAGTDIKGHMRSHQELLEASGYASRPRDFDELLRILDGQLRLITPTDPEGVEYQSVTPRPADEKSYQLTHDYLVPSLRDWLSQKQRQTWRGRAELRLAERSASWNAKPENRHLPSLGEFCRIQLFTRKKNWNGPQRKMMGQAARVHGIRWGIAAAVLVVAGLTGMSLRNAVVEKQNATRAEGLVDGLLKADIAEVRSSVSRIEEHRIWTYPLLKQAYDQAKPGSKSKLHAAFALLALRPVDQGPADFWGSSPDRHAATVSRRARFLAAIHGRPRGTLLEGDARREAVNARAFSSGLCLGELRTRRPSLEPGQLAGGPLSRDAASLRLLGVAGGPATCQGRSSSSR